MIFLWIFLLIAIIIVLKYIYLIVKRRHLIEKIRKQVKKQNGSTLTVLCNNDNLMQGIKVCGLKYFVENVL